MDPNTIDGIGRARQEPRAGADTMSRGSWGAAPSIDGAAMTAGTLPGRSERDREAEERNLVRALRQGNEAAFVALVRRHHTMLRRMARLYVALDVADGLEHDVWSSALDRLDRLEGAPSIRVVLLAILHEHARRRRAAQDGAIPFATRWDSAAEPIGPSVDGTRFRTGEPWPGHWAASVSAWLPDPVKRFVGGSDRARIEAEIAALPGAQGEVLVLRDVEGWTAEEVSAALGISESRQRLLLHAARSRLRAVLDAIILER